jgi:hypothetical protein
MVADDDVVFRHGWLTDLEQKMMVGILQGAKCFGEHFYYFLRPDNLRWHQSRPWWKGRTPPMRGPLARVDFVTGGWWLARHADMVALDWPDPELQGNGGDVALGSAMYQRGWKICGCPRVLDCHNTLSRGVVQKHPVR